MEIDYVELVLTKHTRSQHRTPTRIDELVSLMGDPPLTVLRLVA